MKDFIGQELSVGDRVVHGVGGRYGGLDGPYYIHSFSPKQVRICRAKSRDKVAACVPSANLVKLPEKQED